MKKSPENSELLTPSEVADMFRVDVKTVTRWARQGKIGSIRTIGGHRRYSRQEVKSFIAANSTEAWFLAEDDDYDVAENGSSAPEKAVREAEG